MIVCGTGHRPDKFPWYDRKKTDTENEYAEECLWIKEQIKKHYRQDHIRSSE